MPTPKLQREFNELMEEEVNKSLIFDKGTLDSITNWVESNLDPEDVFTTEQLEQWATDNGYKKQ
jgi:hypothetical protein